MSALLQWLSADEVTVRAIGVGVPACGLLFGFSTTMLGMELLRHVRLWTVPYLVAAAGGMTIYLCWPFLADHFALVAADAAPSDPVTVGDDTYIQVALLWQAGWCLLGMLLLVPGFRWLGQSAGSVLAALVAGFMASLLLFAVVLDLGFLLPQGLRVPCFLLFLAADIAITAIAARRGRRHSPRSAPELNP